MVSRQKCLMAQGPGRFYEEDQPTRVRQLQVGEPHRCVCGDERLSIKLDNIANGAQLDEWRPSNFAD